MNKQRIQQLAGIKPLFEQGPDPKETYMQWEDEMKEQFIEQNPHVTDNENELEIDPNGSVYHRKSDQRWPEGTVTPWDDYYADAAGSATDAAHERGKEEGWKAKEQQERAVASGKTRAVASGIADQFVEHAHAQTKADQDREQIVKELMATVHSELQAKGYNV